jgi:hypothetical protein
LEAQTTKGLGGKHREETEKFYTALGGQTVRVGMEASGHSRWFEHLRHSLQFELWIGDAAEIRTKRVRSRRPIVRTRSCCCAC